MKIVPLLAALLIPLGLLPSGAQAADLTLNLQGRGLKGSEIRVALYNNPDTFLELDRAVAKQALPATGNTVTLTFHDLPPGRYAVSSFADTNGNHDLDTGLLGIPSEPYGFSRDARGRFGPPDFAAAAFDLPPEGTTQTFRLR